MTVVAESRHVVGWRREAAERLSWRRRRERESSDQSEGDAPVPIPTTVVKPFRVDGTALLQRGRVDLRWTPLFLYGHFFKRGRVVFVSS